MNSERTAQTRCPKDRELRQWLVGLLPTERAEALALHVEVCGHCVHAADQLHLDDPFVKGLTRREQPRKAAESNFLTALIGQIRELPNRPPGPTAKTLSIGALVRPPDSSDCQHASAESMIFDPAQEADEMGRLGPCRVLRLLGRGGMGAVYLAEDPRLKRLVALKLILASRIDGSRYQQRFAQEAEALARLQHPHIVQIHQVGTHHGQAYFVLEYVEGGNLADALRKRTSAFGYVEAATLVATLAGALQYAHSQGVIHRDLKPANVLLSEQVGTWKPEGTSKIAPTPKVTDFGLAKCLDDEGLTQTGDLIGTLGYMAPELTQGGGKRCGPAVDVYSLGAILYELLAGRPPFLGETALETLEQARTLDPVAPRRLRPELPRDLDTVCLKCLEKDPARRYSTAQALADDLGRFLGGRPTVARPPRLPERLMKWARRRPALATLAVVSALTLASLVGGSALYERELRTALNQAEVNREQADTNYRQVRAAMSTMLASVSMRSRAELPKMMELRREQQEAALAFYLSISQQGEGGDAGVRADVALACLEAGLLQRDLGRREDAKVNLERARDSFARLAIEVPDEQAHRHYQAQCLNALGPWYGPDEQARCYREAMSLLERVLLDNPTSAEYRASLAHSHHGLGLLIRAERAEDAERHFRQALVLQNELLQQQPASPEALVALAQTCINLSLLTQQQKGRRAQAQEFHDRAEAALELVLRQDPNDFSSVATLATLRLNWAYMLAAKGQSDLALADLGKNVELLERSLRLEPNHAATRDRLFRMHGVRAQLLEGQKRYREELLDRQRVVELLDPGPERDYQRLFLAAALARSGYYARAMAEVDSLAAVPPRPASYYQQFYHLAGVAVAALAALDQDRDVPSAERMALAESYSATAVSLLNRARIAARTEEWRKLLPGLLQDEAFHRLRERTDFKKLLED